MYLLTRVPGAACTTFVEKDERFLSFSEAVLNALRCSHRGKKGVSPSHRGSPGPAGARPPGPHGAVACAAWLHRLLATRSPVATSSPLMGSLHL